MTSNIGEKIALFLRGIAIVTERMLSESSPPLIRAMALLYLIAAVTMVVVLRGVHDTVAPIFTWLLAYVCKAVSPMISELASFCLHAIVIVIIVFRGLLDIVATILTWLHAYVRKAMGLHLHAIVIAIILFRGLLDMVATIFTLWDAYARKAINTSRIPAYTSVPLRIELAIYSHGRLEPVELTFEHEYLLQSIAATGHVGTLVCSLEVHHAGHMKSLWAAARTSVAPA